MTVQALPPLAIDDVLRELRNETGNTILAETADEAKVIAFRDWLVEEGSAFARDPAVRDQDVPMK